MANKSLKSIILPVIVVVLAFVVLYCVNLWTYPTIVQARMQGEVGPAMDVMPNAKGFIELNLDNVPSTVETVYEETSGQGYVVKVSTKAGFTKEAIVFYIAIDKDNKVQKINVTAYPETREVGEGYVDTFIGSDSTLSTVELVAGVTYSSSAIKNGVADAFKALSDNGLIVAAKKEPKQLYEELMPVVFGTAVNPAGMMSQEDFTSKVGGVVRAQKATNEGAVAYWYAEGEENYAVITNGRIAKVYDLEGNEVSSLSSSVLSSLMDEAKTLVKDNSSSDGKRFKKYVPDSKVTEIDVPLFNNVTTAFECVNENGTYYGFGVRPYAFDNEALTMYISIDDKGAIYSFNCSALYVDPEYFTHSEPENYTGGLVGVTDSWSGEEALITGATLTSEAVRDAINDVFDSFKAIKGGN
ncbi:MAG: FMN-binding protein [Candidatus Ornithospirochaeta sp.]